MNNSFTKQCIQQLRRVTDQFSESYRGKKEKSHFATQSQMIKSGIQKLKVFKKRKKSQKKKKKEKRQSPKGKKKKKNKRHAASLYATLYTNLWNFQKHF